MPKCKNHANVEAVYDGLCQNCLNLRKKGATVTAEAVKWTPDLLKKTFASAMTNQGRDKSGGYFLVNGAKGMHIHVYGSLGMHVKVGNKEYRFINVKGQFAKDAWTDGIAAVTSRAVGEEQKKLLAAMALCLSERGGGLSAGEIGKLIAALPIPTE